MNSAALAQVRSRPNRSDWISAFKAPLLERILDRGDPDLESDEPAIKRTVLDFSMPSQSLLDRLRASGPCAVQIADLYGSGSLTALNAFGPFQDPESAPLESLLPPAGSQPLDLILCWDVPNYLSLEALSALCDVLAQRAAPGCQLHMLIAYAKREMPAIPPRYSMLPDGQLRQVCENDTLGAAPRYSPEDLGKAASPFRYDRGVLLANGMQEFVYTRPA